MSNYPAPGSDPNRQNPFEPPRYDASPEVAVPLDEGSGEPRRVTFDEVFNGFWAVASARGGQVLLAALPLVFSNLILQGITTTMFPQRPEDWQRLPPGVALGYIGVSLVLSLFVTWLALGQIRLLATLARTGQADFGLILSGGPWLLRAIGVMICVGFVTFLGFLACCIPGYLVTVLAWPATTVLMMENRGVFDTLGRTRSLTEPSLGPLTLVFTAMVLIGLMVFVPVFLGANALVGPNLAQLVLVVPVNLMAGFANLMQVVCWCRTSGRPLFTDASWTVDPNQQKSY